MASGTGPCFNCPPMRPAWTCTGTTSTCLRNPSQSPTASAALPIAATVVAGHRVCTHEVAGRTGSRRELDHPQAHDALIGFPEGVGPHQPSRGVATRLRLPRTILETVLLSNALLGSPLVMAR